MNVLGKKLCAVFPHSSPKVNWIVSESAVPCEDQKSTLKSTSKTDTYKN